MICIINCVAIMLQYIRHMWHHTIYDLLFDSDIRIQHHIYDIICDLQHMDTISAEAPPSSGASPTPSASWATPCRPGWVADGSRSTSRVDSRCSTSSSLSQSILRPAFKPLESRESGQSYTRREVACITWIAHKSKIRSATSCNLTL